MADDHQCCPSDPVEQNRNFAHAMIQRAQGFMNAEGREVAASLLAAARSLLTASNGVNGLEGAWLLTAEAHIPAVQNDHQGALYIFEEALFIARNDLEEGHYAIGVCLVNVADTHHELGAHDKAEPLLEEAFSILEAAAEANDQQHLESYLASVLTECVSLSKKVRRALGKD